MAERSLRLRALEALSRREYSRIELARKLAPHAENRDVLEALLDTLERERKLSNARFAESLAHRRSPLYGSRRIAMELDQHKLAPELVAEQLAALALTETARCRGAWEKKFGVLPDTLEARARQTRFLSARGFAPDSIRRVLGGTADEEDFG